MSHYCVYLVPKLKQILYLWKVSNGNSAFLQTIRVTVIQKSINSDMTDFPLKLMQEQPTIIYQYQFKYQYFLFIFFHKQG